MGFLTIERFNDIISTYNIDTKCSVFIETGTYIGRTVIPIAKNTGMQCYTIEIIKELSECVKNKYKFLSNIEFIVGDSINILPDLLKNIKYENIIIFLDAHSSNYGGNNLDTIHTESKKSHKLRDTSDKKYSCNILKNKLTEITVPLIEELKLIRQYYDENKDKNILIIIDDYNMFGVVNEYSDWSSISKDKCLDIFDNISIETLIYDDPSQLLISIKPQNFTV